MRAGGLAGTATAQRPGPPKPGSLHTAGSGGGGRGGSRGKQTPLHGAGSGGGGRGGSRGKQTSLHAAGCGGGGGRCGGGGAPKALSVLEHLAVLGGVDKELLGHAAAQHARAARAARVVRGDRVVRHLADANLGACAFRGPAGSPDEARARRGRAQVARCGRAGVVPRQQQQQLCLCRPFTGRRKLAQCSLPSPARGSPVGGPAVARTVGARRHARRAHAARAGANAEQVVVVLPVCGTAVARLGADRQPAARQRGARSGRRSGRALQRRGGGGGGGRAAAGAGGGGGALPACRIAGGWRDECDRRQRTCLWVGSGCKRAGRKTPAAGNPPAAPTVRRAMPVASFIEVAAARSAAMPLGRGAGLESRTQSRQSTPPDRVPGVQTNPGIAALRNGMPDWLAGGLMTPCLLLPPAASRPPRHHPQPLCATHRRTHMG